MPCGDASAGLSQVLLHCCNRNFHYFTPAITHQFGRNVKKILPKSFKGRNREALRHHFKIWIQLAAGNTDAIIN
jgi:hypothetical protein